MVTQKPTTVEPKVVSEGIPKSPSWTPSYSTTIQGASPRIESQAILKDNSEPDSDILTSDDVPDTTQVAKPVPAPAEPVAVVEVPEPTVTDDTKSTDEPPAVDVPPEEPSKVFDPSLDQAHLAQSVEVETERPKSPWTPSYTVTTLQNSGFGPRVDPKPEPHGTLAVEAEAEVPPVEKVKAVETPEIVTPADEEIHEPATATGTPLARSYSVTSQPGSPRISPKSGLEEFEPEPQPVEPVQETPAPIVELANVPKTVVTPAAEDEGEHVSEPAELVPEEESKPAWTQSYSVISQPGSPRVSPKQVPDEISETEEVNQSWAQSYSVTSQPGSPRVLPKAGLPEPTVEPIAVADEPTMIVTPPVEESTPAPAEAEIPARPKSPLTSSYSITTLESQTEQAPPQGTGPVSEIVPIPREFVGEAPEPTSEVDAPVTDVPSSEPLAIEDEHPERPNSPWTPSYSVTTIPGSVEVKDSEPTDKPPVDVEVPAPEPVEATKIAEDQQKENGTTSDVFEVHEAIAQLTVPDEPQADVKVSEPAPLRLDLVSYIRLYQTTHI